MDEKLKKKAGELEIEVNEDMSDSEIQDLIDAKEKELESLKADKKTYDEDEFRRVVTSRDKAKQELRKYKSKVKELEDKIEDAVGSDEVDALKEELKTLQDFKKDYDEEQERIAAEKLTESEKLEMKFNKQIQKLEDKLSDLKSAKEEAERKVEEKDKENKKQIERFRIKTLKSDIIEAASKHNVFSTFQVYKMTSDLFEWDEAEEAFVYYKKGKGDKRGQMLYVDEYIDEFLKDEANENLIKSKANNGPMHSDKHKNDKTKGKLGGYNPKDPKIIDLARKNHMTEEQYIKRVLIPKDKLREKRNA